MTKINVRQATLDDVAAITEIFCSHIHVWQRLDADGRVEDKPYQQLKIYERWLHGGAWMSPETGAIHLNHLLMGAGMPFVAEVNGRVLGYAETYHSYEPQPFGENINLATLKVHADALDSRLDDALMNHCILYTEAQECPRFMASVAVNDTETATFYHQYGLQPLVRVQRFIVPTQTGQVFYRAIDHPDADPSQIEDRLMTSGRYDSPRQHWETLWPGKFDTLAELRERQAARVHFTAAGQDAFVFFQQQLYDLRAVDVYCWSNKPLSWQFLAALRDWAHKAGYRRLVMGVTPDTVKTLGPNAEADGFYQEIYALDV
ncbi:MAG: GNAT family N-acetyltransferase [Chloroflexi bacterium]|nr:MAG: GNAT family N-acetyltransferase [Chloroflexota bacterium]